MLNCIILDDEKNGREALRETINANFPHLKITAEASKIGELAQLLLSHKPDVLFLDIIVGNENIMDILPRLDTGDAKIIFTTGYTEYIHQALRLSALDYLLKPIGVDDLGQALTRLETERFKNLRENLDIFKHNLDSSVPSNKKIGLPTNNKLEIISLNEIIYCKSDGAYTVFYITDKRKIMVSKNLHEYEIQFAECGFCRVHHSYLINTLHIKTYIKGEGGSVIMSNGNEIDVSRRKKNDLMAMLIKK